jgi:probable HAF family extracellular repeat protein
MQAIGTTRQLQVEARDSANQVIPDPQVVFTSSDPSIITVDANGLLRAVALGRAFINARIENQEHSVFMQVVTGYDVLTEIGTLGGDSSRAFAVNDQGYVAGDAQTASGEWHAFVYRGGELTDVGPSGVRSRAVAVNASGTVVGNAFPSGDTIHGVRPFQWKNGVTTDLPLPDGSESGFARDINDSGTVVGYSTTPCSVCSGETVGSALRWDDGVLTDLGRLGGQQGYATAINAEGRIAGGVEPGGGGWIENGIVVNVVPGAVNAMSEAGHLVSSSGEFIHIWRDGEDHLVSVGRRWFSAVHGVDRMGQVIATIRTCFPQCTSPEAVIRLPDDRIFGLNDMIAPVTSWRLEAAMGMSENGLIAGYGRATPESPVHAVVLKPRS